MSEVAYTLPLPPIPERVHSLIARKTIRQENGCLLWQGRRGHNGYARTIIKGRHIYLHRIAFFLHTGTDPVGYIVCHHCDTPWCLNGKCLFLGDNADNAADRQAKGRTARGDLHGSRLYPHLLRRGENHQNSLLKDKDVIKIRALYSKGTTQRSLAQRFKVKEITIWKVVHRVTWRHI